MVMPVSPLPHHQDDRHLSSGHHTARYPMEDRYRTFRGTTFNADGEHDQSYILTTLKDIEHRSEKSAVGFVNTLFSSSSSQSLDKVCLNIFTKIGNEDSLDLIHGKYPHAMAVGLSLLPSVITVFSTLGGHREVEYLLKIEKTHPDMFTDTVVDAIHRIAARNAPLRLSEALVPMVQELYFESARHLKVRILDFLPFLDQPLLLSLVVCGINSEDSELRMHAVQSAAAFDAALIRPIILQAFRQEEDEDVLFCYDPWLIAMPA